MHHSVKSRFAAPRLEKEQLFNMKLNNRNLVQSFILFFIEALCFISAGEKNSKTEQKDNVNTNVQKNINKTVHFHIFSIVFRVNTFLHNINVYNFSKLK